MNRYLDFDLNCRRTATGFRAQVISSPAGQASAEFNTPFSELEIENLLLRIGRPRRSSRRMGAAEMTAVKAFGGKLFAAVFAADVLACFRMSLEKATEQGAGLRIRLRLAEAPELIDLPWEYLYNATLNRFLGLSAETPIVRYLDLAERIKPLLVELPIRVLVVVSSPSDYPALDVEAEWSRLKNALADLEIQGRVVVERLPSATLQALQRRLRRETCHVFHFIGHGGFNEQSGEGLLVLEDKNGRADPVSSQYLGTLLHDHKPLRIAVLNACEGARGGRTDPFAGTAQSLVQQGIPAVIAMQFEITDEAAVIFAHELYMALADGCAIDTALAEARKALFAQAKEVEWGTPVLYMRASDGRIFELPEVPSSGLARERPSALAAAAESALAAAPSGAPLVGDVSVRAPRVYVSYSWDSVEHKQRVLELSDRLRGDGVETRLDQYEAGPSSWKRWQEEQVSASDFVVMVCTEEYRYRLDANRGHGAYFDGQLIRKRLSVNANHDWLVVSGFRPYRESSAAIPPFAVDAEYYNAGDREGYERLVARLLGRPLVVAPPVSPPRARATLRQSGVDIASDASRPSTEDAAAGSGVLEPLAPLDLALVGEEIRIAELHLSLLRETNDAKRADIKARDEEIRQRSLFFPLLFVLLVSLVTIGFIGVAIAQAIGSDESSGFALFIAVVSSVTATLYVRFVIKRGYSNELRRLQQESAKLLLELDASEHDARFRLESLRARQPPG